MAEIEDGICCSRRAGAQTKSGRLVDWLESCCTSTPTTYCRSGPTAPFRMHLFDRLCRQHGIEHRLTRPNHPWTNGQVERYHYDGHQQLTDHLDLFVVAYNHARRLKTLNGLTPHEYVCQIWTQEPERFRLNPYHHTPGLNS